MPPPQQDASTTFGRASALAARRFPWLALAGSLIVHALALVLVANAFVQERAIEPSDRIITLRLAAHRPGWPEDEPGTGREMPVIEPESPIRPQDPAGPGPATTRFQRPARTAAAESYRAR